MSETPTTLYLVRHGETASNVEGRFRGKADIPLSENGLLQAQNLADALSNVPLSAIYSSPLSRALKTAEPIAQGRNLKIKIHPGFDNINLGEWTDRPKAEIEAMFPELWKLWITEPEKLTIPDAEAIDEVRARSFAALEELAAVHEGETFAVVTHRAVIKPLVSAMLDLPAPYFWRFHLDTASYSIFRRSRINGWTMVNFNLTHHLFESVEEIY